MTLQLDPLYDVAFICETCGQVFRGPHPLEAHMATHVADTEPMVPVGTVDAVPINATEAVPVTQRTYTCSTCKARITGYGDFMAHKRAHKKENGNV